jgi:flagellar basal body rod protein FlgF
MFYVQRERDGMLYAVTMDELNQQPNKAIENKQYIKEVNGFPESNKISACPALRVLKI